MAGSVLIIDDGEAISTIVAAILSEEGFIVSEWRDSHPAALQTEVARLEPDVVLLDGCSGTDYGYSWLNAAWMRERSRPISVIMFTAHSRELAEARLGESERSKRAGFAGFLPKPFDVSILVETVACVARNPTRCSCSSPHWPAVENNLPGMQG